MAALEGPWASVEAMVASLRERRDLVVAGLNAIDGANVRVTLLRWIEQGCPRGEGEDPLAAPLAAAGRVLEIGCAAGALADLDSAGGFTDWKRNGYPIETPQALTPEQHRRSPLQKRLRFRNYRIDISRPQDSIRRARTNRAR